MQVNVITFGQIIDITGSGKICLEGVADTNELIQHLHSLYPALASTKYAIAVDKKIIKQNTCLTSDSTVALLPPFSGG